MIRHFATGILIIISLLVVSCGSATPDAAEGSDPYAVFTEAAQTALANEQELANATATLQSEQTPAAPVSTTQTPGSDQAPGGTATSQSGDSGESAQSGDKAEFVRDVTIPDGTELPPNGTFTKTWRLKNVGNTTWTTDYKVVYIGGDRMGASEGTPLPRSVAPREEIDVSVQLTAPDTTGTFTGYFNLETPAGDRFGVGVGSIEAFWLEITVSEDAAPLATSTPSVSADAVTQVFLYSDVTSANQCPYTYNFKGIITLSEQAPVTYQLEATSTTPGFAFDLPEPVTVDLGAGSHNLEFPLTFRSSVQGTLQLHVTFPGDHLSNPVAFALNCP